MIKIGTQARISSISNLQSVHPGEEESYTL
jgi:hypothetical protein